MNNNGNGLIAPRAIENNEIRSMESRLVPVPAAAPGFDAAHYWSYLDDIEASDAQKAALLEALWSIMARFVEIGFGVDPVQTVIPALIRAALDEEDAEKEAAAARDAFGAVSGHTRDENNKKESADDDC